MKIWRKILVADEDEITFELVERPLNSLFRVLRVREGKRAIELAQQGGIEIAIVSTCLPDMDGIAVLKTLTKKFPAISVILVADNPAKDLIISAFRCGAKDFIEKPIDPGALMESIHRIIGVTCKDSDTAPQASNFAVLVDPTGSFTLPEYLNSGYWIRKLRSLMGQFFVYSRNAPAGNHPEAKEGAHVEELQDGFPLNAEQEEELSPNLSVYCLGRFQVVLNRQIIENWTSRKGRELFTYLVMNHKRRTYRDILMETFWPNTDQDSARNSLNVAIHNVRGILHEVNPDYEYILFKEECYFLNPGIDVWVDVEEFLHYWKIAQRTERQNGIQAAVGEYEAAAALYHGDFLEEDLYESWPSSERENLKEIYLFVLDRLSNYYSQDGKPSTAASLCETILAKDNCREDIHQRLMRCYCRLEQREKAVKQYRKCVEALEAELDVKPTRATIELYERIKHGILTREDNEIL